jgi:hypothetical protein
MLQSWVLTTVESCLIIKSTFPLFYATLFFAAEQKMPVDQALL